MPSLRVAMRFLRLFFGGGGAPARCRVSSK
jgi:hypothetical protein